MTIEAADNCSRALTMEPGGKGTVEEIESRALGQSTKHQTILHPLNRNRVPEVSTKGMQSSGYTGETRVFGNLCNTPNRWKRPQE